MTTQIVRQPTTGWRRSVGGAVAELIHPCVDDDAVGVALSDAALTDQDRLGIVLQGGALLSHLARAGQCLGRGWGDARVARGRRLTVPACAPGVDLELPQHRLTELVHILFRAPNGVAGRGEARRIARVLVEAWRQDLEPEPPDLAVQRILDLAGFLWRERHGVHRVALAGETLIAGRRSLWIAGPGPFRSRFLSRASSLAEVVELLVKEDCEAAWSGFEGAVSPGELVTLGRWQDAVRAFRSMPPETSRQRRDLAKALFAIGRFESALPHLKGLSRIEDRLLRLSCQYQGGQLVAARRTLARLQESHLEPRQLLEVAEISLRVLANVGDRPKVRDWIARCLRIQRPELRSWAKLVAAEGCWDLGDLEAMKRHLDAVDDTRLSREHGWRRHQAQGLLAARRDHGAVAVEQLEAALRCGRRQMKGFEAGRVWSDVVLARVLVDDLSGAERAARHSWRLLSRCEGPLATTLGLYNLAEVRIRRGRLGGVPEILSRAERLDRHSANVRGAAQDAELRARLALARGRPLEAVETCRLMLAQLEKRASQWNDEELRVLAARAHGWLGAPERGRALLGSRITKLVPTLEPEECPALWAHLGLRERALVAAEGFETARLWRALLLDGSAEQHRWSDLDSLEPYRAARLVCDANLLPGVRIPDRQLVRSAEVLRQAGAEPLARRLEDVDRGRWSAISRFLDDADRTMESVQRLLREMGLAEAEVSAEVECREVVVVPGDRGSQVECLERNGVVWRLRGAIGGARAAAVLRLIAAAGPAPGPSRQVPTASDGEVVSTGLVGECPLLLGAVERASRFGAEELPLLLLGETGTGKELFARFVHRVSRRAGKAFVAVNCAAMSENLLLSELFGHVRGSFTGAERDREGLIESASGGTIFLDEVGDLPLVTQGMLLRTLQEGEIRRVGESRSRHVDIRVITATHRDLDRMVVDGTFRRDLFYRLQVGVIRLPPLRHRHGDVLRLADHYLGLRGDGCRLSRDAADRLRSYSWPGNVRQLFGVLESACALVRGGSEPVIHCDHLGLPDQEDRLADTDYHAWLDGVRREKIETLEISGGSQAEAAPPRPVPTGTFVSGASARSPLIGLRPECSVPRELLSLYKTMIVSWGQSGSRGPPEFIW